MHQVAMAQRAECGIPAPEFRMLSLSLVWIANARARAVFAIVRISHDAPSTSLTLIRFQKKLCDDRREFSLLASLLLRRAELNFHINSPVDAQSGGGVGVVEGEGILLAAVINAAAGL